MFEQRFIFVCQYSGRRGKPGRRGKARHGQMKRTDPEELNRLPFLVSETREAVRKLRNRPLATTVFARLGKEQPTKPYFSPMLSMMVSTRPSMLFSVVRYGAMRSV